MAHWIPSDSPSVLGATAVLIARMVIIGCVGLLTASSLPAQQPTGDSSPVPAPTQSFLKQHCYDCHSGETAEAGLDLDKLPDHFTDAKSDRWVRIFDRVKDGEMPPPDHGSLDNKSTQPFLEATQKWITSNQFKSFRQVGRVQARRLTNLQLERTLHDLLGVDNPLAVLMPDEPRTAGFTTVANGQAMSHFQLQQHLGVVDAALDEAFRRALTPTDGWSKKLSAERIARKDPTLRNREPEMLDGKAVVWAGRMPFYGQVRATKAREAGWYRFEIRAKALKAPENRGVWCTVRSGVCNSGAPLMGWIGSFEANQEIGSYSFEGWLPKGHMIEVRPGDATLKEARFEGGQVDVGLGASQGVSGVAIESIQMSRIHRGANDQTIRQLLFGELKVSPASNPKKQRVETKTPRADLKRLIQRFAQRAFRRPVGQEFIKPYTSLAVAALDDGESFSEALGLGYRAVLCSPRFLYLHEPNRQLDHYAIAARLSYLIWSTMPDKTLLDLAAKQKLRDKTVLRQQVERMLADPKGEFFVKDLAHQWLDLSEIDFTEPDRRQFRSFDIVVQNAMLDETHSFLQDMLDRNLSVSHLIDSEHTFLNSRLARYYGIKCDAGNESTKVLLDANSKRGGLLTQGAIMKVTANGTNTSPIIRGVWVSERLLGEAIPPPPENVPAIEPDIRGAKSIREMLAKHQENGDCAACHRKIDPPGFALENFDPAGNWRDQYIKIIKGAKNIRLPIDSSFEMPDGQSFRNINQFKRLVLSNKDKLAKNVVEKLLVYGTGAEIHFADRGAVERCVKNCAEEDFGFREILKQVVTSNIFLTK